MATKLSQPEKIYPASGAGSYRSIDIEVADNGGFMVRCREREKPSKGDDGPMAYQEPKTEVVSSVKELIALIKHKLGKTSGEAAEGE